MNKFQFFFFQLPLYLSFFFSLWSSDMTLEQKVGQLLMVHFHGQEANEKAKQFRHHPEKMMEIQKEVFPISTKLMKLSSRPLMFTGIPFILIFRWYMDTFTALGDPKFFGFLSWFWFYLIFTMIFSGLIRKWMKVA